MRISNLSLAVVAAMLMAPAARAQLPNASQQVETLEQRNELQEAGQSMMGTNVPALYEGETSDVGPQSVVEIRPRRTWIEAYADEQYFYTDNMLLADHLKQGADVLVSTVQAAVAPSPYPFAGGQLAPRVGYQEQWFNYGLADSDKLQVYNFSTGSVQNDGLDVYNFDVSTIFGDLTWRRDNWLFTAGGDFRQLHDPGSYAEFYREYVPRWTVERQFPLTQATALAVGYDGDYRISRTQMPPAGVGENYFDRTDHSLFVVGSWQLCQHAVLQPFYRLQFTHYTQINRDDWLNSFGLTLYCPLTKYVAIRGFVGYDVLNTDSLYAQNYEMLNAGGGVNLFVRF